MRMQHRSCVFCIYRTLIQQRLLVEFSCELPTIYLSKRFTCCRSFVLCDKWLPQQQNSTTSGDSVFRGLLNTYSFIILDCKQCTQCQEDLAKLQALREIPTKRANLSRFVVPRPTGEVRCITLCGCGRQSYSCRRLMLQDPFVTCPRRVVVLSIKKHLVQRFPAQG